MNTAIQVFLGLISRIWTCRGVFELSTHAPTWLQLNWLAPPLQNTVLPQAKSPALIQLLAFLSQSKAIADAKRNHGKPSHSFSCRKVFNATPVDSSNHGFFNRLSFPDCAGRKVQLVGGVRVSLLGCANTHLKLPPLQESQKRVNCMAAVAELELIGKVTAIYCDQLLWFLFFSFLLKRKKHRTVDVHSMVRTKKQYIFFHLQIKFVKATSSK